MSEILLFSRLMSSLVSARTFRLSSWTKINHTCINKHAFFFFLKLSSLQNWPSFSHLQSAFELLQLSLHFLYEEQQKEHRRFIMELTGKLKNKWTGIKKAAPCFQIEGWRTLSSPGSPYLFWWSQDEPWAAGLQFPYRNKHPTCEYIWKKGSASDIKNRGIASYLVGFGYHVFINNIHVCCG